MSRPGLILYVGMILCLGFWGEEIRVGLVLGGGAARGLAHIGVLKALEEYHIPVDAVGGTSMGAIVGGLWASGYTASEIESIFTKTDILIKVFSYNELLNKPVYYKFNFYEPVIDFKIVNNALKLPSSTIDDRFLNYELQKLFQPVNASVGNDFRNLWKPFLGVSSDVNSGQLAIFTHGELQEAIRASMSLPVIFEPVNYNDKILMDGGIYNNLPVKILKDTFDLDYIIAIDVSSDKTYLSSKDLTVVQVGFSMLDIITSQVNPDTIKPYGTYIHPDVGNYVGFEFNQVNKLIELGYNATVKYIRKLKNDIQRETFYQSSHREIANMIDFNDFLIDSIEINSSNPTHKTITRNVLGMQKCYDFSFADFDDAILRLQSLDIFNNIKTEFYADTVKKTLRIKLNNTAFSTTRFGLGGYYSNNAGMNLFANIQNNNLFSRAISLNLIPILGEHNKGVKVNIYSPPVFISRVTGYIHYEYSVYKMYSLWHNSFTYNTLQSIIYLMGNNFEHNSMMSLFTAINSKNYMLGDYSKLSFGSYYITDNLGYYRDNKSGYKINILFSINFPEYESYTFFPYDISKLYIKLSGDYISQINIFWNLLSAFTVSAGYIRDLQQFSDYHPNIQSDYFSIQPLPSFKYIYESELLASYYLSTGLHFSYPINETVAVRNLNSVHLLENESVKSSLMLITSGLYIEMKGVFGYVGGGIEYITDNSQNKFNLNIFWSSGDIGGPDILSRI